MATPGSRPRRDGVAMSHTDAASWAGPADRMAAKLRDIRTRRDVAGVRTLTAPAISRTGTEDKDRP